MQKLSFTQCVKVGKYAFMENEYLKHKNENILSMKQTSFSHKNDFKERSNIIVHLVSFENMQINRMVPLINEN